MSATCAQIINLAAKDAGILGEGQTLSAEDYSDALLRLNWMIDQWRHKRFLVWHLVTTGIVSTGAQSYTVGPQGDFNLSRAPDKLEAAFFRQINTTSPNQVDYSLEILFAREDYNNITIKDLASFPNYVFYDSDQPLGNVFAWPVPDAAIYQLFITTKAVLPQFAKITDALTLGDDYAAAMQSNLAIRLAMAYKQEVSEDMKAIARDAYNVLRMANGTQIARLMMPPDLIRPGIYNPYSDQIR